MVPSHPFPRRPWADPSAWVAVLCAWCVLGGCTPRQPELRVSGDADGVPVTIAVRFDPAWVDSLSGATRTVVIERETWGPWASDPWYPHHHRHYSRLGHGHPGYGPYGYRHHALGYDRGYEPATAVHLLIGEGPAEGQFARFELIAGERSVTVPLRPGRTVVFTAQATGGRSGWQEIGRATVSGTPTTLTIALDRAGGRVETPRPPASP